MEAPSLLFIKKIQKAYQNIYVVGQTFSQYYYLILFPEQLNNKYIVVCHGRAPSSPIPSSGVDINRVWVRIPVTTLEQGTF